jgi:hypothetical protein
MQRFYNLYSGLKKGSDNMLTYINRFIFIALAAFVVSCISDDSNITKISIPAPTIASFAPVQGEVGSDITISGSNLDKVVQVQFNGKAGTVKTREDGSLVVTVPNGATTGKIKVISRGGVALSAQDFTALVSSISSFVPAEGKVGTEVTITGAHLGSASAVQFNNVDAAIVNKTATSIVVKVPEGATKGKIKVIVPSGTLASATDFNVLIPPAPTITAFTPVFGKEGDEITLTGTNFDEAIFKFGDAEAEIIQKTGTTAKVKIPTGVASGLVTLSSSNSTTTNNALTPFTVIASATVVVPVSDFEGEDVASKWGIAEDAGDIDVREFISNAPGNGQYYHLVGSDKYDQHGSRYWVGGNYLKVDENAKTPFGVTEGDPTKVYYNVDIKSNIQAGAVAQQAKLVFEVYNSATNTRTNWEQDFPVNSTDWKRISIRIDKFHRWNDAKGGFESFSGDIKTVWVVALYLTADSRITSDFSWDNVTFSQGAPLGTEIIY